MRVSTSQGAKAPSAAAATSAPVAPSNHTPWLTPHCAASYLGVPIHDLVPLVEDGRLKPFRSPDQGVRFSLHDLDAAMLPMASDEAVRQLAGEALNNPQNPMTNNNPTLQATSRAGSHMPLKDAATLLNQPYKALLRLVHAGEIPATNLGTVHRPRFVVDPDAIKRLWDERAQRDMRRRSAPAQRLDFSRLLGGTSGKGVGHG